MLIQTKQAVDALLNAGYNRSEFCCRTPRNSRGEYELPRILVWASKERQLELAEAVAAAGLNVYVYKNKATGHYGWPAYELAYNGGGTVKTVLY